MASSCTAAMPTTDVKYLTLFLLTLQTQKANMMAMPTTDLSI